MKKSLLVTSFVFTSVIGSSQQLLSTGDDKSGVIYCSGFHITKPLRELAAENPIDETKLTPIKARESDDRKHRKPQKFVYTAEKDGYEYATDTATMQTDMGKH